MAIENTDGDAATTDNEGQTSAADDSNQDKPIEDIMYPDHKGTDDDKGDEDKSTDDDDKSKDDDSDKDDDSEDKEKDKDKDDEEDEDKDDDDKDKDDIELKVPDLPENMQMDEERLTDFKSFVKENGEKTVAEAAQGLFDMYAQGAIDDFNGLQETIIDQKEQWGKDVAADEELAGKSGEFLNQNADLAKKAFDAIGTPELKEFLEGSGLGNHPELVRMFKRVGESISEDGLHINLGLGGSEADQSQAQIMYPNE